MLLPDELKNRVKTLLKYKKDHPNLHAEIAYIFEKCKNIKDNGRILLGLWERARGNIRDEIYQCLEQIDFENDVRNTATFEIIKCKMNQNIDRNRLIDLLKKCEKSFRDKAEKILIKQGIFFRMNGYMPIKPHILNYKDIQPGNTYHTKENAIFILADEVDKDLTANDGCGFLKNGNKEEPENNSIPSPILDANVETDRHVKIQPFLRNEKTQFSQDFEKENISSQNINNKKQISYQEKSEKRIVSDIDKPKDKLLPVTDKDKRFHSYMDLGKFQKETQNYNTGRYLIKNNTPIQYIPKGNNSNTNGVKNISKNSEMDHEFPQAVTNLQVQDANAGPKTSSNLDGEKFFDRNTKQRIFDVAINEHISSKYRDSYQNKNFLRSIPKSHNLDATDKTNYGLSSTQVNGRERMKTAFTEKFPMDQNTISILIDKTTHLYHFYDCAQSRKVGALISDGNFHLIEKYLKSQMAKTNDNFDYSYLNDLYSLILRLAKINGPSPQIMLVCNKNWKESLFDRQLVFRNYTDPIRDFKNYIGMSLKWTDEIYSIGHVFLFYQKNNVLQIYDCNKGITLNTRIDIKEKITLLSLILFRSRETISRKTNDSNEIRKWWIDRYKLNTELQFILDFIIDYPFPDSFFICLDEELINFPFEHIRSLENKKIMRLPCSEFISKNIIEAQNDFKRSNIQIMTGSDMQQTEQRIKKFIEETGIVPDFGNLPQWVAYFGHGSGKLFLEGTKTEQFLLFGCSSAKIIHRFGFKRIGFTHSLLSNSSNTIMGCLWDVTDHDIDTFGMCLIKNLVDKQPYHLAMRTALATLRLRYLNGASIVCYSKVMIK